MGKSLESESEIIYSEEIQLYNRMKEKDKEEILFFINDFDILFSNNNAESMQRRMKKKQNNTIVLFLINNLQKP